MLTEEEIEEKVCHIPPKDVRTLRCELIRRIESITQSLVLSLSRGEKPKITYDDGRESGWTNTSNSISTSNSFTQNADNQISTSSERRLKTIRFSGNQGRQRLAIIMRIFQHVHTNLIANLVKTDDDFYHTRRAFFYSLKNEHIKRFVKKQDRVLRAINEVAMILQCGPWDIGFISTSKGLVAGDLTLHLGESRVIQYDQQTCQAVPDVVDSVTRIATRANFVLVIEKDSVFQRLLREHCAGFNKCILITGKGYPDIPTRMLVHLLSVRAHLPVYALVDANPHGLEIMCVYRFGTLNNWGYREQLLCPHMRWLGVHQNDLSRLDITKIKLTPRDQKKIKDMKTRSYIVDCGLSIHLDAMRFGKAEIESVNKPIKRFLSEVYIPLKVRRKEYF
ncbi:meiotic recombination protein SPO11-1 [Copidosoma floridanum]|uniref:meiotic recombination protein SPO11-1 n=1 Tax=Copidosoma floridanum TaxID=29053 RepID=UPI0006C9C52D|nr:meiotic recombination protein SPO11-1 [Copidosoma floridanum]